MRQHNKLLAQATMGAWTSHLEGKTRAEKREYLVCAYTMSMATDGDPARAVAAAKAASGFKDTATIHKWAQKFALEGPSCLEEGEKYGYALDWPLASMDKQEQVRVWMSSKSSDDPRQTSERFAEYLTKELLCDLVAKRGRGYSARTARRYLRRLGYMWMHTSKSLYFDGHEMKEVVADRVAKFGRDGIVTKVMELEGGDDEEATDYTPAFDHYTAEDGMTGVRLPWRRAMACTSSGSSSAVPLRCASTTTCWRSSATHG